MKDGIEPNEEMYTQIGNQIFIRATTLGLGQTSWHYFGLRWFLLASFGERRIICLLCSRETWFSYNC